MAIRWEAVKEGDVLYGQDYGRDPRFHIRVAEKRKLGCMMALEWGARAHYEYWPAHKVTKLRRSRPKP